MTLEEMRSAVWRRFGESGDGNSPAAPDSTDVDAEINLAVLDVYMKLLRQSVCFAPSNTSISVVADTREYSLSDVTDFMALLLCERVDGDYEDNPVSADFPANADFRAKNRERWRNRTLDLYLVGNQTLGFLVMPTETMTLKLYYAPRPSTLTAGSSPNPLIPIEYHEVIVQTAVVELYAAESSPEAERARAKLGIITEQMLATVAGRQKAVPAFPRGM